MGQHELAGRLDGFCCVVAGKPIIGGLVHLWIRLLRGRPPQLTTPISHATGSILSTTPIKSGAKAVRGCCSCRFLFPGLYQTKQAGCCRPSPVGPWRAAAWGRPAGTCARRRRRQAPSTAVRACAWECVVAIGWRAVVVSCGSGQDGGLLMSDPVVIMGAIDDMMLCVVM